MSTMKDATLEAIKRNLYTEESDKVVADFVQKTNPKTLLNYKRTTVIPVGGSEGTKAVVEIVEHKETHEFVVKAWKKMGDDWVTYKLHKSVRIYPKVKKAEKRLMQLARNLVMKNFPDPKYVEV